MSNNFMRSIFLILFIGFICLDANAQKFMRCSSHLVKEKYKHISMPSDCIETTEEGYGPSCANSDASITPLPFAACGKFRVPIAFRKIAMSDGTGISADFDTKLDEELCFMNQLFDPINIEFFECSRPDPILSDDLYTYNEDEEFQLTALNIPNVINIYMPSSIERSPQGSGVFSGGYAALGGNSSNPLLLAAAGQIGSYEQLGGCGITNSACPTLAGNDIMWTLLSHEMGHYFGLEHTFEYNGAGEDLADGSTSCTTGDLTEDTPPDPYTIVGGTPEPPCDGSGQSCEWNQTFATANDANGIAYNSFATNNIMSYWDYECLNSFTPFQYKRMSDALNYCATYLCCGSDVENYLADVNQQNITVCQGDALPEITGVSGRCYSWYADEVTTIAIVEGETNLSSLDFATAVDTDVPGNYTIYVQNANAYQDPPCRTAINITVNAGGTNGCAAVCPTLTSVPVALSITSESACGTGCTPVGGSWSLDSSVCPSGSSLQTFADGTTTTGGTALTAAPGYNQATAETFHVRCVCDIDANTVSPVQTISSTPGTCTDPVATTNDATVCSGTTSEAITVTATTGTATNYSIDYDATAEGAGFVDVATTAIAGASYIIPSGAAAGTYNGIMTYTDANGCSGTDAFTITVNICASCPSDPTATVDNTTICSSGIATLALGATAGTATTANFVLNSMPMGVTFSPASPAPEGSVMATFPANTTCDPIAYTITIDAVCSNGDDIANDPSNLVVTVYPEIAAANLVVTNGNCAVAPSVSSSCVNYNISLNGDADDIVGVPTAGQSGTNDYTITYTGAPACFVNGTAQATYNCPVSCPTLDTAPVALSITSESACGTGCTPAGGSWSLDSSVCPSGSSLQTFADGTTTTGGTALTAAPGYNQATAETFHVRCVCDIDANTVSPVQTISSTPGTCTDPVATTNDATVCSGTTSEAITVTATTGTPTNYSIDYDATAEGAGFVDVATTAIAGASYVIPSGAAAGTYNGIMTYTDANGCSGTDAFTITVNICASCPSDPTATVDNTTICSSGIATLALGATAGTATTANFVLNSMPMGVTFSPVSPAPEGSVTATFPANTTCDPIAYTITIDAVCSNGDDIANDPSNLVVTVYPEIAAANLVVTNGNCAVAPSVTSACSNYNISLNGDADDIVGVPSAGQSGTNNYTITYTGAPACFVNGTAQATYESQFGPVGSSCDDGDNCTVNDMVQTDCSCAGTFADADNDGTCDANDVCANGPEPNTPCDDGDDATNNDMIQADCSCMGSLFDCAGVLNGNSTLDECGVCDDDSSNDNQTCTDCAGVVNGTSTVDACGVCDDDSSNDNQTCTDCAGVVNGTSTVDACGVCDDDSSNDNQTCTDCAGVVNGTSIVDACGVCDDDSSNDNQTCTDCAGVVNGTSTVDACGVCDDDSSNDNQTCTDCAGVVNGTSTVDACGVCDDDSSNDNQTCTDCAGVVNGTSTVDACGVCDDDSSNDNQTCTDCAGVVNGTSTVDACGVCDDDSSNDNQTCTDCAGVVNGTSTVDACGVCDDDSSNDNQTCTDCAGVVNGDAQLDECGVCDGPGIAEGTCDCEGTPEITYYADNDGDLLGDPNNSLNACEQPEGYVTNKNDLDDSFNDLICEEPVITTEINCLGNGETFEIVINIQEAGSNETIVIIDDLGTIPAIITNEVGTITFGNYANDATVELFVYSGINCEGYLEIITSDCVIETEPCDLFQVIPTVQCNDNGTFQIVTTVVGGSGNYAYSFEGGNYEELIGEQEAAFVSGTYADGEAYDISVIDSDSDCEITINNTVECVKTAIELLSFEGRMLENSNYLSWVTASEIDNDYFEVLRSRDGVNFEVIGKINGAGNSSTQSFYEFSDIELTSGVSYYQLNIVDINGSTEISNVIDLNRANVANNISIMPNPATDYINISFVSNQAEILRLKIYDISGKLVEQQNINSEVGENSSTLNIESLSKGLYFIQLEGNALLQHTTFIVN